MPLDWSRYDAYFETPRQQSPVAPDARHEIESLVAQILRLDPAICGTLWGACSPPGVSAQTVVRVPGTVSHQFRRESQGKAVGVKLFKTQQGPGAPKQSEVIRAHVARRTGFPGLPSPHVQEVYSGGEFCGRFYLIQEWIEGEPLGDVLGRKDGLPVSEVRCILNDLYRGILIPLWSKGAIWWDIRDANYCLQPLETGRRLVMIDTDSLVAYAREIVETPSDFTRRDSTKQRAMARVKTIVEKLAWAPFGSQKIPRAEKSRLERSITAIRTEAEACFLQPGCLRGGEEAFERMLQRLNAEVWSSPLAL